MGMTMTQKILAAHAGLDSVEPGQLILVNLDRVLGNDITSPVAIREFNKLNKDAVFDKEKVTMVMDHFAPNKDIKAATQCKMCRDFCGEKEITHFYDVGQMGIEHALLPEKGLVVSGDVVIGADSHTCTYGALGAFSTGVGSTDMACGMAIEAGAKNGIFEVDDQTLAFVAEHSDRKPVVYKADEDAVYDEVIEIDLSEIKSTVAFPHLPGNTRTIDEVGEVKIDQVVIGSCTNGFYKDIEEAASIIRGKKVAKNVRAIIIPATQAIYLKAMENGLLKDFIEAGCVVSTPTCGPCLGGHMGILAAGERAVSTTNRNFVGRMGHPESEVYLASPAVAAASAIAGKIVSPKEVL